MYRSNRDHLLAAMMSSTTPSTRVVTYSDYQRMNTTTSLSCRALNLQSFHSINLSSGPVSTFRSSRSSSNYSRSGNSTNYSSSSSTTTSSTISTLEQIGAVAQTAQVAAPTITALYQRPGVIRTALFCAGALIGAKLAYNYMNSGSSNNDTSNNRSSARRNSFSSNHSPDNPGFSASQNHSRRNSYSSNNKGNSPHFQPNRNNDRNQTARGNDYGNHNRRSSSSNDNRNSPKPNNDKNEFQNHAAGNAFNGTNSSNEFQNNSSPQEFPVYVKTLTGKNLTLMCKAGHKVFDLKSRIENLQGTPIDQQVLIFGGQHLENWKVLGEYKIEGECVVHLAPKLNDLNVIYLPEGIRAPTFDYDFTDVTDSGVYFKRGGFDYKRPVGCLRLALNVLGLYGDDQWLGCNGRRMQESSGEWPVSYHGTGSYHGESIAERGYNLSKSTGFSFNRGTYTTPDIKVALLYAKEFNFEGNTYKFVLQNRVNPTTLKIVAEGQCGEYWVNEKQEDVRPYGICIK